MTHGKALGLAVARRGIHRHYAVFPESSAVFTVYSRTSGEYSPDTVGQNGSRMMFPVHKVLGRGMSPGHVLPFGAIGIPLVIQMPYAILIEHTVGVVHPAVGRGMMI